jgi:hypothetical protein
VTKVHFRNKSRTGWWVYREILYWVSRRQKKLTAHSRCLVWDNLRIIKAKNRNDAFAKAKRTSSAGHPAATIHGEWRFAGIADLLPISEKFEDGSEILWFDRGWVPVRRLQRLVKSKKQLSVFDDSEKKRR